MGNDFYILLGAEKRGDQLFYQVLDIKDGEIDSLSQKELNQVNELGFKVVRLYSSNPTVGVKHMACKLPESSIGVLFRVQNTKVVAMPFDERGFYKVSDSSSIKQPVDFYLTEATRVRVYLYLWKAEVYLSIKNEFRDKDYEKVEQYSLCKLDPASLTYTRVIRTRQGNEADLELYGRYISNIEEKIEKNHGFMTHIRSVKSLYDYSCML